MGLVLLLHRHGCALAANHVPRKFNEWADELTSSVTARSFIATSDLCSNLLFLPRILNGRMLILPSDLSPTQAPVTGAWAVSVSFRFLCSPSGVPAGANQPGTPTLGKLIWMGCDTHSRPVFQPDRGGAPGTPTCLARKGCVRFVFRHFWLACLHTHTYMHAYIHTYIHTYIHRSLVPFTGVSIWVPTHSHVMNMPTLLGSRDGKGTF